ncbi:MAG: AMP-binding protein [Melioribacteraceae bacterium]|nr:AMP-binding protein [Melioribacteraceae bacterium]MCF8353351.1 AMP-binding protein [Melioribacteraceae bacterium]MCF8393215.1 AMP-binding protein [Melioribacteraceae bacterium]MCF8419077.1 AMP-binding protein [Melioribacteraceae bacterium]
MVKLEKLTLLHLLKNSYEKYRNNPSLSWVDSDPMSYEEFYKKVLTVSQFLHEKGIIPGDKVAILSENQPNWGVAYFAITTLGAVAVPIMHEFHNTEVHHILRHSGSKAIFISSRHFGKLEELEYQEMKTKVLLDDFTIIPEDAKKDLLTEVLDGGKIEIAKFKGAALKFVGMLPGEVEEDSLAAIIYTSGTTGHSKGVMLTHKNLVYDAVATRQIVDINEPDRFLSILPLAHTYECTLGLIAPIMLGASVYYLRKPPTPAALLPALKQVKPTVMLSVPLVIEKIYRNKVKPELKKKKLVSALMKLPAIRKKIHAVAGKKLAETFGGELRIFTIGGAALAADVELFLREAKFPYAIGYGLTETAPLIVGTGPDKTKYRSTGTALPGMEFKVENPDPKTGEGEILLKGPNIMKGYYRDSEKTAEVLSSDGWFRSGDRGVVDKDDYLYIKGRSKNVIIGANGKNIYPEEIESVLNEQPCVEESLVYEREGQLWAKVFLNYNIVDESFGINSLSEPEARKKIAELLDEILNILNESVASYNKLKKVLEQPEPFEKTPTMKIKRYLYV